jgi:ABC-2 type transport system ATP-binding protein
MPAGRPELDPLGGVRVLAAGLAARGPRGEIFSGVDVNVPAGGIGVVAGPSGSGRSSCLLALAGRFRLESGDLQIGRTELRKNADGVRALVAVARVNPELGPEDELTVARLERQRTLTSGAHGFADAYELVGVEPSRKERYGDLHPLDRLLVAVALAVAEDRQALVVDDVDEGLPAEDLARAWRALDDVAAAGRTVLASALDGPGDAIDHVLVPLLHPRDRERREQTT